jgi:hypothetical protein
MSAWNWHDLVPENVAVAQQAWERKARALRMRTLGFAYKDIAKRFGISAGRAHQIVARAEREKAKGHLSPVEGYMHYRAEDMRALGRALGGRIKPADVNVGKAPPLPPPSPTVKRLSADLKKAQEQAAYWEKEARFWYQRADELMKQQRRQ